MDRPLRKPDFIASYGNHYWAETGEDGRHYIYIADHVNDDWYISVFDSVMMDDEPQEVHNWYKTVAPANVLMYFNRID